MNKNILYTIIAVTIGLSVSATLLLHETETGHHDDHDSHEVDNNETVKGPHGGRLLQQDDLSLELTVYEKGIPPEFRVYAYTHEKEISPADISLDIQLMRLDGQLDSFRFKAENNYLRGIGEVTEPHSFDVQVTAKYKQKKYSWSFENYEGRVNISSDVAQASGIQTKKAQAQTIIESLKLTGRVQVDPNRLSQVRARFPGMVKAVKTELGARVNQGDVLAIIQSNESLQAYQLQAPISGVIIQRDIQAGEVTADTVLFSIADLSAVWAELDVFNEDITRVKTGQQVTLETLSGEKTTGRIDWISPMLAHASQSIQARVILDNPTLTFRPGQFIRGRVTVAEHAVPLAVRRSAIQSFRDFQVVFAKINDSYEVRMLELGRSDNEWVEVLGGLKPGTDYVTANSYLIKADIEKSGASHDH